MFLYSLYIISNTRMKIKMQRRKFWTAISKLQTDFQIWKSAGNSLYLLAINLIRTGATSSARLPNNTIIQTIEYETVCPRIKVLENLF